MSFKNMVAHIIEWSEEDQAYIGTIPKMPGCIADGATIDEAKANLENAKREWLEEAKRLGRDISHLSN